jgi:tetratricopeptide (TPR) repeat protein
MKRAPALLLILAIAHIAPIARADDKSDARAAVEEARQHFQRGVGFFRDGSYEAALAEFGRAYERSPNYRILYNLGQVQAERHDYAAALRYFRSYLDQGGNEIAADRRAQVETDIVDLEGRVARVTLDVNTSGAEILVDEVPFGTAPLAAPLLVNAGVRSLVVRKPGYATILRRVTVVGGETTKLELRLQRESDTAARVESAPSPTTPSRAPLWVALGATATLGAASATFAVMALRADGDLGKALEQYPADQVRVSGDRSREKTFAALADALGAAAVVALGVTVYVAATTSSAETPRSARARVDLRVVPRGVELSGRF